MRFITSLIIALALTAPAFAQGPWFSTPNPTPWYADRLSDPHARTYGGESCLGCHATSALNQVRVPASPPEDETMDVVVVGGGMAGLSALHYLKHRKAVVLELEREAGGQMRADTWRGIKFAKGAAYFVEPYGVLKEFYDSNRVPMVKIHHPENSAWIGGRFFADCWSEGGRQKMPWTGPAKEAWLKFLKEMEEVNNTNRSNQPFDAFDPEQRKLDLISTRTWLKDRGLNDEMIDHLDRYIPSCFGEKSAHISAAAFANYISGEIGGNYTLPGGLGGLTEVIYNNLRDRVRLGCRVTRISQDLSGARVDYIDAQGRPRAIRARTVITAVPCNLLPEMMPDLPAEKKKVIANTRYASYMVAAVLCNEVLWDDKGYDTWIQGSFFNDIIDATWISRHGEPYKNKKQPHVLSLYIPTGLNGLGAMSDWSPKQYEQAILRDLEKLIPGSRKKVAGVRLYRWGHSMHVATPGFMTNSVPVLRKPYYRVYFAGAEVEGLPCNESAILSGYAAARGVETWLWDRQPAGIAR
jgi:monoamine oxidase